MLASAYIKCRLIMRGEHAVTDQIDDVHRQVVRTDQTYVVSLSQTYDTDIDDTWDACTNPERLGRWFAPISGDLRLGGRYQLDGNAGGTIERCDPPKGFAATWEYDGDISRIEVRLTAEPDGRTRFTLEHTVPDNEHWAEFGPGAIGVGWDIGVQALAVHLAGREVGPEAEWAVTPQGVEHMTLSSTRWCEANIAAGADAAVARAMADRVTAAYTAVPRGE